MVIRKIFLRVLFAFLCISIYISGYSQEPAAITESDSMLIDSIRYMRAISKYDSAKPEIMLSTDQALIFLSEKYEPKYWNDENDALRRAIGQLIFEATYPPHDSATYILKNYPYDSLSIPWEQFYVWDSLGFKIPVISSPEFKISVDSMVVTDSSAVVTIIDTTVVADTSLVVGIADSNNIKLVLPKLFHEDKPVVSLKDTAILVIVDTLKEVSSSSLNSPLRYLTFPYQSDSIQVAVQSLINYLEVRDSSIINFTGVGNVVTPLWMNSRSGKMMRYWLNNEFSDSVTIWIGNTSRDTIGLYIEQGINFRRPVKQRNYAEAKVNIKSLDNSKLLDVQKIIVKKQYWKYRTEASFNLNQAALTNWVKGGENSISTAMDVTGYADYNNKKAKLSSSNFARMKLGFLRTGDKGIRKNLDLLETSSKLNHKAFGKFDFSGIMLFKTQSVKGYSYPNDSVPVSKFMNPAILTIGFGLDYKPNKTTSINFSPLSYKGTFVPDTANIDQTKYGILKDKKSKNEPGASLMVSNKFKLFKKISVTNRFQIFTNYINNPQNIDIDWEMIAVASLNWFTDIRLNTHFIFDDNTKTTELDKDDNPVLRPDGTVKKTARIQFKEMIGLSFVFKF